MPLICFASPKGGVGKSTLAANVASELARIGWTVLALDLDPQNALRLHFGMALQDRNGFMSQLPRQQDWRRAIRPTASGVHLLPYGSIDMRGAVGITQHLADHPRLLQAPLAEMLSRPDVAVVLDTEPGPSASLAALLPAIDILVSVLLNDPMSAALVPAIETGNAYGTEWSREHPARTPNRQCFVLNQFDPRTRLGNTIANGLLRHAGRGLLGIVHRDEHVAEAVAAQKLVADYAPSAQATFDIKRIAQGIAARLDTGGASSMAVH